MEVQPPARVISVDKLFGGVIITFDDGRSAIYSASLLLSIFPRAEDISQMATDEDDAMRSSSVQTT